MSEPLTDAELDYVDKLAGSYAFTSMQRAIAELRELRELRDEHERLHSIYVIAANEMRRQTVEVRTLREQKAMLVEALKVADELINWIGTPVGYVPMDFKRENDIIRAALASVKGGDA